MKKHKEPFKRFNLQDQEYDNGKGLLIAARKQEMEGILPGFYTICQGQKIYSPDYMKRSLFNIGHIGHEN